MIEPLLIHWRSVLKIIAIAFVNLCIFGYFFRKKLIEYLRNNWTYYRNKPYIVFISGFVKPEKGLGAVKTTIKNFISFLWNIVLKFLKMLMMPFYPLFKIVVKILNFFKNILDRFRQQFKIMRNFLLKIVQKIYMRLSNGIATMTYFFLKLREGIKRQLGLFKMLSWTIAHSYYFMRSLLSGSVTTFGNFAEDFGLALSTFAVGSSAGTSFWFGSVCFDPETKIKLANGTYKCISNINIEDILEDGSCVKSVCEFDITNAIVPIFDYQGIIVSGDHVVYENDKPIRIAESKLSKPYLYQKNKLYCLITDTSKIPINDLVFSDYLDSHNTELNLDIQRIVENKLNRGIHPKVYKPRNTDLIWGFSNKNHSLSELKIGDTISGKKILGKVVISKDFITPYLYQYQGNTTIVSGNVLVKENRQWIRIAQSRYSQPYTDNISKYYINYITEDNTIQINNTIFSDFMETSDICTNKVIDNIVDLYQEK